MNVPNMSLDRQVRTFAPDVGQAKIRSRSGLILVLCATACGVRDYPHEQAAVNTNDDLGATTAGTGGSPGASGPTTQTTSASSSSSTTNSVPGRDAQATGGAAGAGGAGPRDAQP